MTEVRTTAPILAGPRRGALGCVLVVGPLALAAVAALPFEGAAPAWAACIAFAATAAIVLDQVGPHHPHPRFGLGNAITLARAGGTAVLVALAFEPALLAGTGAWVACAGVALLLGLDGLDGRAARQQGLISAFGARFDMEVDALLILALSAIAAGLDKAGAWILGIGLMRYVFVAAGWLVPALARPLPPSRRRSAICGVQVTILAALLAPPVVPPWSGLLAAAAFATLVASFAIDVAWLVRHAR